MADGCYDLDGKCVNCGGYHPCKCESDTEAELRAEAQLDSWLKQSEQDRADYEEGLEEMRGEEYD
jgi:hypothetical protein